MSSPITSTGAASFIQESSTVSGSGHSADSGPRACLVLRRLENGAVNFRSANCSLQLQYICKRSITGKPFNIEYNSIKRVDKVSCFILVFIKKLLTIVSTKMFSIENKCFSLIAIVI